MVSCSVCGGVVALADQNGRSLRQRLEGALKKPVSANGAAECASSTLAASRRCVVTDFLDNTTNGSLLLVAGAQQEGKSAFLSKIAEQSDGLLIMDVQQPGGRSR